MEITTIVKLLIEKGAEIYDISTSNMTLKRNEIYMEVDYDDEILTICRNEINLKYPFILLDVEIINQLIELVEE